MDSGLILDAIRQLNSSTSVLLVLQPNPTTDALAAAIGIAESLRSADRRVAIYCPGFIAQSTTTFLTEGVTILPQLVQLREFIIRVGLNSASLESLRYETNEKELRLFLLPKHGYFEGKDVQLSSGSFSYDHIITLGVQDIAQLGSDALEQKEFFSHTPITAIDHLPAHKPYAQITLLDTTATSISEIAVRVLEAIPEFSFSEGVATKLFAGIMSGTNGFQAHTVTPKALATAATLLNAGARRDVVVRHLFQIKTLPVLQLWGRALAGLQRDVETGVAHTMITRADMQSTKTAPEAAAGLLDELLVTAQEPAVLFGIERDQGTELHIVTRDPQHQPKFPDEVRRLNERYAQMYLPLPPQKAITEALHWWSTPVPGR